MPRDANQYCGIAKIPRGKVLGTPEYCMGINQVRYYGLELIPPGLLEKVKNKESDLIKEQLKLKHLQDEGKLLIRNVKNVKVILETEGMRASTVKKAELKYKALLKKRDKLVKKLKDQQEVVRIMEEDKQAREEEEEEKRRKEEKKIKEKKKKKK